MVVSTGPQHCSANRTMTTFPHVFATHVHFLVRYESVNSALHTQQTMSFVATNGTSNFFQVIETTNMNCLVHAYVLYVPEYALNFNLLIKREF